MEGRECNGRKEGREERKEYIKGMEEEGVVTNERSER